MKEFIQEIEKDLKGKYNMLIPAFSIEVNDDIQLDKADLLEFFSYFGEINYININKNQFYVLYKYFTSCVFAFDAIERFFKNQNVNAKIKMETKNEHEEEVSVNEVKKTLENILEDFKKNSMQYNNEEDSNKLEKDQITGTNDPNSEDKSKVVNINNNFYFNDEHKNKQENNNKLINSPVILFYF